MGSRPLLQGIFPTQGWNLGHLHCRQIFTNLATREALSYLWQVLFYRNFIYGHWNLNFISFSHVTVYNSFLKMFLNSNHKNHFKIIKTILSLLVIQKSGSGQLWQQAVICWPPVYRIKSKSLILNKDFSMHCLHLTPLLIFPIILYSSHSSQCD